ncbi:serine/threonine-protein kinase [Microbispora sp. NPDC088329]|uniref:serine/threonine-protein kinase n=1 Tax=Microbispora sp. NPDC088329 TaxID=3154869 RepID=UPI00341A6D46
MTLIAGRYRLDPARAGGGGMGEVWGAVDERLGRRVAIKFVRFPGGVPDRDWEARFRHEATIMARLCHPGTPAVHDAGAYDDPLRGRRQFIVMEYVEGAGLDDVVAETGALPVGWVASIGAQVAAVLDAAHAGGILHRDLKPANLMLRPDGSVQVVDFGLAIMHDPALTKLTRTGEMLGTESYMSPEQVRQEEPTARSDLYALGCVLHELLTGRTLFTGPTAFSVMRQQVSVPPAPAGRWRAGVPAGLDDLLLSMLAKNPEDRPGSAREVHDRLMPYLADTAPLPGFTSPAPSPARMYAAAAGRTGTDGATAPPAGASAAPADAAGNRRDGQDGFSRGDLRRARQRADALVRGSRYAEAAAVLAEAVAPAGRVLGANDSEVLSLGVHLADVLFEGGDHLAAAQAFHQLAAQLGPGDERAFQIRMREATCLLHLGDTETALRLARDLLAGELRAWPGDDPRTLELRRQVGELEVAAGRHEAARRTLDSLLGDLTALYGSGHPATERVREILAGL